LAGHAAQERRTLHVLLLVGKLCTCMCSLSLWRVIIAFPERKGGTYLHENSCMRTHTSLLVSPALPVPVAGLWLFSHSPVDPTNTAVMREAAQKLGYDLSVLKKVQQQGCTYPESATAAAAAGSTSRAAGKSLPLGGLLTNVNFG
jgi:hypothetical protein